MKGKRKTDRQKKKWENNIKEWTGMNFASSARAVANMIRWKGIVANSSVCPDDHPWLWDRIQYIGVDKRTMLITVKIGHYTAAAIMYKFRLQPINLKRQVNDYTRGLEPS